MKKSDFITECADLGISKELAVKLFVKANGDITVINTIATNPEDAETACLDWLNEPVANDNSELAIAGNINAAPDVQSIIVKVIGMEFQPSYGGAKAVVDDDGFVMDRKINYARSHFDIRGIDITGKLFSVVAGYPMLHRAIGSLGDDVTDPVAGLIDKVLGQFVIIDYQHVVQGTEYRKRDDSDPTKSSSVRAQRTANHLVTLMFDKKDVFAKEHALAEERKRDRDNHAVLVDKERAMSGIKIDRAKQFLTQMSDAHAAGLEFDPVALLKELVA